MFDFRTFDCVRLPKCLGEFDYVRLPNPIQISPTTEVRLPNVRLTTSGFITLKFWSPSCYVNVTLLQLLTSWPLSRDYCLYECHPIVCLHDIDSALEITASDFSASRQPSELLKLIKYFTILCLTNGNAKLKKKKRQLAESSETSWLWNVSCACWQIHLRRIQADGIYTGGSVSSLKLPNIFFLLASG